MTSITTSQELLSRIAALGLPEMVARIATEGGVAVHPELEFSLSSVYLSPDSPAQFGLRAAGHERWVPLWQTSATTIVFALPDGSFAEWNAEADEQWLTWADYPALVRSVLTDLYEDEVSDQARAEVAGLLLPGVHPAAALELEDRSGW